MKISKPKPHNLEMCYMVYVVITDDDSNQFYRSWEEAQEEARALCDSSTNVQILAITRAWSVIYPEEPEPEVSEESLDILC